MSVCFDLGLKRQTWWLACNLTDRQLHGHKEIQEKDLKQIGVTCLCIAAKQEETPQAAYGIVNTDFGLSESQINKTEGQVLAHIEYNMQITSPNDFLNLFMTEFDQQNATVVNSHCPKIVMYFKQCNVHAYSNYFQATTILDCVNLSGQIWQYSARIVAMAVLYVVWDFQVQTKFGCKKNYNLYFDNFYIQEGVEDLLVGLSFKDMHSCVNAVKHQVNLDFKTDIPKFQSQWGSDKNQFKTDVTMWEEQLSFQLYHKNQYKQTMEIINPISNLYQLLEEDQQTEPINTQKQKITCYLEQVYQKIIKISEKYFEINPYYFAVIFQDPFNWIYDHDLLSMKKSDGSYSFKISSNVALQLMDILYKLVVYLHEQSQAMSQQSGQNINYSANINNNNICSPMNNIINLSHTHSKNVNKPHPLACLKCQKTKSMDEIQFE